MEQKPVNVVVRNASNYLGAVKHERVFLIDKPEYFVLIPELYPLGRMVFSKKKFSVVECVS